MNENKLFIIAILIAFISIIISITYYNISHLQSIEKNIETAIQKGIDPVAVRCSYSTEKDNVCIAYVASHQTSFSIGKNSK
jgi:hypothetical protein